MVILSDDESDTIVCELLRAGAVAYVRKELAGDTLAETLARDLHAEVSRRAGADEQALSRSPADTGCWAS